MIHPTPPPHLQVDFLRLNSLPQYEAKKERKNKFLLDVFLEDKSSQNVKYN